MVVKTVIPVRMVFIMRICAIVSLGIGQIGGTYGELDWGIPGRCFGGDDFCIIKGRDCIIPTMSGSKYTVLRAMHAMLPYLRG